jgi:hypothetical protein
MSDISFKDLSEEDVKVASEKLSEFACYVLCLPRSRLKEVKLFDMTELNNKTGLEFIWDPPLSEEQNSRLFEVLKIVNTLLGGSELQKIDKEA